MQFNKQNLSCLLIPNNLLVNNRFTAAAETYYVTIGCLQDDTATAQVMHTQRARCLLISLPGGR